MCLYFAKRRLNTFVDRRQSTGRGRGLYTTTGMLPRFDGSPIARVAPRLLEVRGGGRTPLHTP